MRSIANHYHYHKRDGVRVNAICPGTVKTNLFDQKAWSTFSDDVFVPIEKTASTVLVLIDGYDIDGSSVGDGGSAQVNGAGQNERLNGKMLWN